MTDAATHAVAVTTSVDTRGRVAAVILAVGLAALAATALWLSRGFTFIVDEWDILAHHVHGDLLTPYNGHLSLVPVGIYQALAHTVGVGSYLPWSILGLVVFLAVPLVFHLTHRHRTDPILVALAALGIAWSWAAQMNIMYGFLINFDLPLVMLFTAWWLIARNTPASDWWAMAALAVALASSSIGVVVAFAVVVEMLIGRVPLRRLARMSPPVVAWLVWWTLRHEPTTPAGLGERLAYAWNMSVGILSGFTLGWRPGAIATLAVIVAVVVSSARHGRVDAHVWAIGATLVFFVALSSFSRAGDIALNPPDASRYVWVGDLLIVAALVWCVRGRQIPLRALGAVALVMVVGAVATVGHLRDYRAFALADAARTRPFLVAAEAAGPAADPDRILPLNLIPVTVGEYLDMVATVGSPVTGVGSGDTGDPVASGEADAILIDEVGLDARPVDDDAPCRGERPPSGRSDSVVFELAPGAELVIASGTAPVEVTARRLAPPRQATPIASVAPHSRIVVTAPVDASTRPWHIALDDPTAEVCTSQ